PCTAHLERQRDRDAAHHLRQIAAHARCRRGHRILGGRFVAGQGRRIGQQGLDRGIFVHEGIGHSTNSNEVRQSLPFCSATVAVKSRESSISTSVAPRLIGITSPTRSSISSPSSNS